MSEKNTKQSKHDVLGKTKKAFTLIELLVVISIIAILMAIMVPALARARESARSIFCSSNQRNIYTAMMLYKHDSGGLFFPGMNGYRVFDYGRGTGNTGNMMDKWHPRAYWGVAYMPYLDNDYSLFRCPAKKWNNGWWNSIRERDEVAYDNSDYGINGYTMWEKPEDSNRLVHSPGEGRRRITDFRRPSEVIILHDHPESSLDDNGDMIYFNPIYDKSFGENLSQWKRREIDNPEYYMGSVAEIWRHSGSTNILWLDGHTGSQRETTGEDIPKSWYTGGIGGL